MHRAPVARASLDFFPPRSLTALEHSRSSCFLHGLQRPEYNAPSQNPTISTSTSSQSSVLDFHLPKIYVDAPVRNGLRTPPTDDMNSTASYLQQSSSWGSQTEKVGHHANRAVIPHPYSTSAQLPQGPTVSALSGLTGNLAKSCPQKRSPQSTGTVVFATEDIEQRKSVILPSLQIPASINTSGGSLGEFAAQITCLFWFESTATLRRAEEWTSASSPVKRLVPDAIPTVSFRKWVVTILSTTQVTQNVVLLALLFIYRLKTLNPTVKGKPGSEYRLLTVALMLGNKFLDDNTYTNKTWAEVSGISVGEIHVMEVEFLSNMRYSLLASKEQWKEWQVKLGRFWEHFEKAARAPSTLPSPVAANHSNVLPSPPVSMESPTALTPYSLNSAPYNHNQQWPTTYSQPLTSPLPSMPDLVPELNLQLSGRKRGYEDTANEPQAKRATGSNGLQAVSHVTIPAPRQNLPRLPVPGLPVNTTQSNGYPAIPQNLQLLPPLVGGRAMSIVYPATPSYTQQQQTLTPTGLKGHSASQGFNGQNYGTPSRRHSPRTVQEALSMNSSPISATFSGHNHNSPSFFLQQRSSPYKPVRLPNTLLVPPPSASLHPYPTSIEQMHYQPLGKRNDYRTGVVPEYAAHPNYQNWPVLPQPNFLV